MRKLFKYGGIIASIALIVAGAVSIGAGALGVMQVRDALSAEKIVGSPDMTPTLISAEARTQASTWRRSTSPARPLLAGRLTRARRHRRSRVHANPRSRGERRPGVRRDRPFPR